MIARVFELWLIVGIWIRERGDCWCVLVVVHTGSRVLISGLDIGLVKRFWFCLGPLGSLLSSFDHASRVPLIS